MSSNKTAAATKAATAPEYPIGLTVTDFRRLTPAELKRAGVDVSKNHWDRTRSPYGDRYNLGLILSDGTVLYADHGIDSHDEGLGLLSFMLPKKRGAGHHYTISTAEEMAWMDADQAKDKKSMDEWKAKQPVLTKEEEVAQVAAYEKAYEAQEKDRAESGICSSKKDRLFCYGVLAELEAIDAKGSEGAGGDEDHDLLYTIKMAYEIWKGRPLRLTPEAEAAEKADSARFDANHMKGYDLLNDKGDKTGWSSIKPTEGNFRPATPYDLMQEKMDARLRESLSHF